jgi:anti-anti-sigma factor
VAIEFDLENLVQQDPDSLVIEVTWTSLAVRVQLIGELDILSSGRLREVMDAFDLGAEQSLVLELSQLTFCDCRGLTALVQIHDASRANGHQLAIQGASRQLHRLLAITGREDILWSPDAARKEV